MRAIAWSLAIIAATGCGRVGFGDGDGGNGADGGGDGGSGDGASTGMNLESYLEMIGGTSPMSDVTAVNFLRTQTALDTADYDGVVSYAFEIVANNNDSVAHDVSLVDVTTGTAVATITLAANDGILRQRVAFAPQTASTIYELGIAAAPVNFVVQVTDARIVVDQVGATRTSLSYILTDVQEAGGLPSNGTTSGDVAVSTSSTYGIGGNTLGFSRWQKDLAQLVSLAPGTPWTFEALLDCPAAGHHAIAALQNWNTNAIVPATVVSTDGVDAVELVSTGFPDGATGFDDLNDFTVQFRDDDNASAAYLFKAGVRVHLVDLANAEVMLHISGNDLNMTDPNAMAQWNSAAFGPSTVQFEVVNGAMPTTASLVDGGTSDVLSVGAPIVTGTTMMFPASSRARETVDLVAGDRYYMTAIGEAVSGALIIDVAR